MKARGKTIAVDQDVWQALKMKSILTGKTLSEVIEELLREEVKSDGNQRKRSAKNGIDAG